MKTKLDRVTAENLVVKQLTDLLNKLDQNDLDIPKLELIIRNAFGMGIIWEKEH